MKLLFKHVFLLAFLLIAMAGCEKTDGNDPPILKPAEKQVKEIVDVLGKNPDVSEFTTMLGKLNVGDVEAEELTVFAVKNGGTKSESVTKADLDGNSIKRHIVKGAYKISDLKDGLELISISKESLFISVKGEEVLINQVAIETKGEVVGKSIIYIVPEMIPQHTESPVLPKKTLTVTVLECNGNWNVDKSTPGLPVPGALVKVYTKATGSYRLLKELTTTDKGLVTIETEGDEDCYYTVEKADATPFFDGYKIAGLYTTVGDLILLVNGSKCELGALKFVDVNGDAQINADDKYPDHYLPIRFESEVVSKEEVVYIAPPGFIFLVEELPKTLAAIDENFKQFQEAYRVVDASLSHEANGVNFSEQQRLDSYASTIWDLGYKVIDAVMGVDQRVSSDEWASKAPLYWLKTAFVYAKLINYFGDVPIIKQPGDMVERSSVEEVNDYMRSILEGRVMQFGTMEQKNAASMLLARLFVNRDMYNEAYEMVRSVTDSGMNGLVVGDVFASADNKEVIWGGFVDKSSVKKGTYSHIFRYMEAVLLRSECALRVGMMAEAMALINQIYLSKGLPPMLPDGVSRDEILAAQQEAYNSEMRLEGVKFGNLKRWDTFLHVLGQYGAKEHNEYLPIPMSAMKENPYLKQNVGY